LEIHVNELRIFNRKFEAIVLQKSFEQHGPHSFVAIYEWMISDDSKCVECGDFTSVGV